MQNPAEIKGVGYEAEQRMMNSGQQKGHLPPFPGRGTG